MRLLNVLEIINYNTDSHVHVTVNNTCIYITAIWANNNNTLVVYQNLAPLLRSKVMIPGNVLLFTTVIVLILCLFI